MWRQDRLHGLEIAALTAAESPPSEATVKKLLTFARYGARIDKDIGRALQTLHVLRGRPDASIKPSPDGTHEPGEPQPHEQIRTNESPPPRLEPKPAPTLPAGGTPEPGPRLNRHQRRAPAAVWRRLAA